MNPPRHTPPQPALYRFRPSWSPASAILVALFGVLDIPLLVITSPQFATLAKLKPVQVNQSVLGLAVAHLARSWRSEDGYQP